jgi:hypothetical protein
MSIAGYAVTVHDRPIEAKLPIFGTAVRAWSDVLRATKAMPSLLIASVGQPSSTQLGPSTLNFLLVFGIFMLGFMAIAGVGVLMFMLSTPGWSNDTRWLIAGGVSITIAVAYIALSRWAGERRSGL